MECTWRNRNEEIQTEDIISSESSLDDVEVVAFYESHSKEIELGGENLLKVSVTEKPNIPSMLQQDIPPFVLWDKHFDCIS